MENYYEILNIHPRASQAEIRERYRFLANAYHPDKFTSATHKTEAEAEFKKINEAYQVLSVPQRRAEYDRRIRLTQSPWVNPPPGQSTNNPTRPANSALDYGRQIITTVISLALIYGAIFVVTRVGPGGLILLLILAALIYSKYFWR